MILRCQDPPGGLYDNTPFNNHMQKKIQSARVVRTVNQLIRNCEWADKYRNKTVTDSNLRAGTQIRKLRESSGISLRAMAQRIGCSSSFLSDMERGNRRVSEQWFRRIIVVIDSLRV